MNLLLTHEKNRRVTSLGLVNIRRDECHNKFLERSPNPRPEYRHSNLAPDADVACVCITSVWVIQQELSWRPLPARLLRRAARGTTATDTELPLVPVGALRYAQRLGVLWWLTSLYSKQIHCTRSQATDLGRTTGAAPYFGQKKSIGGSAMKIWALSGYNW